MIANAMHLTSEPRLSRGRAMRKGRQVRLLGPAAVIWFKGAAFKAEAGFVAYVVRAKGKLVYLGLYPREPSICACATKDGLELI